MTIREIITMLAYDERNDEYRIRQNFDAIARAICEEVEKMMGKEYDQASYYIINEEEWQAFKLANGIEPKEC